MVYAQRDYDRSRGCVRAPSVYCARETDKERGKKEKEENAAILGEKGYTVNATRKSLPKKDKYKKQEKRRKDRLDPHGRKRIYNIQKTDQTQQGTRGTRGRGGRYILLGREALCSLQQLGEDFGHAERSQ